MPFKPEERELNFIERRREWKARIEKPLSRRTFLAMIPALALCVFALLSAPYLDDLLRLFVKKGEEYQVSQLNIKDETKPEEVAGPPADPEAGLADFYREKFDKEGFDWRQKPQVEGPDLTYAREKPLPIEPVEVDLPATMSELEKQSK